jgi:hypothetical protein
MIQRQRKLININSKDGFIHFSWLRVNTRNRRPHETPIVIVVHGVLGHFLARHPGSCPLRPTGINTFSINTRMAHLGQIFGRAIFDTAARYKAAVEFLKRGVCKDIHTVQPGANLSALYAANKPEPEVKGLILEGCAYSLPDSQKKRWEKWNSRPSYDEVYEKARELLGTDPLTSPRDEIFLVNRAWGDTFNPFHNEIYTYKTWWFMRSPEAHHAKTCTVIPRVKVPVLFLQGVNDDILEEWESRELARLAAEAGNDSVDVRYIENAKHDCMENPDAASDSIARWIEAIAGKRA